MTTVSAHRFMGLTVIMGAAMMFAAWAPAGDDTKPADAKGPLRPPRAGGGATPVQTEAEAKAVEAANRLLAAPWVGLSAQYEKDIAQNLTDSLEDKRIFHASDERKVAGVGYEWKVALRLDDVKTSVDFSSPPAFRRASSKGFIIDLPRDGWSISISGKIKGDVWVKETVADKKIFDWNPAVAFGVAVKDIRISTSVELDDRVPGRPLLERATVTPSFKIGGDGAIPVSIPVSFEAVVEDGLLSFRSRISDAKLDIGPLNAGLDGNLKVTVLPLTTSKDVEIGKSVDVKIGDEVDTEIGKVDLHVELQVLEVALRGKLKVELEKVGKVEVPFSITELVTVPTTREIAQAIALLHQQKPVPRSWGENQSRGRVAAPAPGLDLTTPAAEIEAAIAAAHLPYGTILSTVQPEETGIKQVVAWTGEVDSAIWTGHYLAAQAFRAAATKSPEAIERVKATLTGIERLFDVTGDAVVERLEDGALRRTAVTSKGLHLGGPDSKKAAPARRGIFARIALPASAPVQPVHGPLSKRPIYYEAPEGGWEVTNAKGTTTHYARYGDIPPEDLLPALKPKIRPLGEVWHGWGAGDNHPVSRDQYAGVFLGLSFAWALVDDAEVRERCARLIEDALDYLLSTGWNVVLPPDNRIQTTFLGNFEKQLTYLRIGATINPAKYGERYKEVAAAASLTWVPAWLSAHDPLFQYYKFNLQHATITPALFFETDPELRAGYLQGYDILWGSVRHHRNAWFDVARLLVHRPDERLAVAAQPSGSNVAVSLAGEIRTTLGEWLERRRLVPGPNGLPMNKVADPDYQVALWPNQVVLYTGLDGHTRYVARFPLPVTARNGQGMDFAWQRHPFAVGMDESRDPAKLLRENEVLKNGAPGRHPRIESPGVDYVLPYWAAVYLGVLEEAAVASNTGLENKTPDRRDGGEHPLADARVEELFRALEQHVADLEARARELESRLAQVSGLPGAGATQTPDVKDIRKPPVHAAASCCAVVANPELKGRFGRIVVAFPKGAKTNVTRIEVFKPGQNESLTFEFGAISAELLPGAYEVEISGKRVKGVEVKAGHDTRVHVGVLRVKLARNTRMDIRDVGAKDDVAFKFDYGEFDIGLPIGAYEAVVNKQADKFTIEADKISEY